jgi:nucleotide-binding universal stress UspA family protein
VGENTIAAARDTAKAAGFEAEAVLIETETPMQQVAETIVKEATRWGADLVVMGTHGRRGFQHLMLGSVAEQTVRRSSGPVLLIPLPRAT